MIVSLRGTSGSGKSTIARALLSERPEPIFEMGQVVGHQCPTFRVVGPYPDDDALIAGVDILNRTRRRSALFEQIERWAVAGNLLYEGLLISNEVGRTAELAARFDTKIIFLTTPLGVCLARVNARRAAKQPSSIFGEGPELVSPKKTTEKFEELQRVAVRLTEAGVSVEQLDCSAALVRCRELLL